MQKIQHVFHKNDFRSYGCFTAKIKNVKKGMNSLNTVKNLAIDEHLFWESLQIRKGLVIKRRRSVSTPST